MTKLKLPLALLFASFALLVSGCINSVVSIVGVTSLFAAGLPASTTALYLFALIASACFLVGLPLVSAWAAFRGKRSLIWLTSFYAAVQLVAAVGSISVVQYSSLAFAVVGLACLLAGRSRRLIYAKHPGDER